MKIIRTFYETTGAAHHLWVIIGAIFGWIVTSTKLDPHAQYLCYATFAVAGVSGLTAVVTLTIGLLKILSAHPVEAPLFKRLKYSIGHVYQKHSPGLQFVLRMLLVSILSSVLAYSLCERNSVFSNNTPPQTIHTTSEEFGASIAARPPKTNGLTNAENATRPLQEKKFSLSDLLEPQFQQYAHAGLLALYLLSSVGYYIAYRRRLSPKQVASIAASTFDEEEEAPSDDPPSHKQLSNDSSVSPPIGSVASSLLDVLYISLLAATAGQHGAEVFMAFLIPIVGVWWVRRYHVHVMVAIPCAVILYAIAIPSLHAVCSSGSWTIGAVTTHSAFLNSIGALFFWLTFALFVMLLRAMRDGVIDEAMKWRLQIEALSASQEHIIFAKNRRREFTYANRLLLELLTPHLIALKFQGHDNSYISRTRPLVLEDIVGKTDRDLGIDRVEYLRSDAEVLNLSKEELRPHATALGVSVDALDSLVGDRSERFADFEPDIPGTSMGTGSIWTTKIQIRDRNDPNRITGLIGEAVKGYPEHMRRMAERLHSSLPVFALMKEFVKSSNRTECLRIVWSNRLHLEKIRPRLLQLARQRRPGIDIPDNVDGGMLLQMFGEDGPTDADLYCGDTEYVGADTGDEREVVANPWREYAMDDILIVNIAREVIAATPIGTPLDVLQKSISARLATWASQRKRGRVDTYPTHGWIERHKFPGEKQVLWVEVRKWPWLERAASDGISPYEVKGLMVIFEDVSAIHVRRNIVWRWTRRHLSQAIDASNGFCAAMVQMGLQMPQFPGQSISAIPLVQLEVTMIGWLRRMINQPTRRHPIDTRPRTSRELEVIIATLVYMKRGCYVDVVGLSEQAHMIPKGGTEVFAICLVLLLNAGQSTLRLEGHKDDNPLMEDSPHATFTWDLRIGSGELVIKMEDQGVGFDQSEHPRIMDGLCWGDGHRDNMDATQSARVLMPGGGIPLIKYLLRGLLGLPHDADVPTEQFGISSPGRSKGGATAVVRIPLERLRTDRQGVSEVDLPKFTPPFEKGRRGRHRGE